MRLLARIVAIAVAVVIVVILAAVPLIYFNQQRIILAILATVSQQTGIDIIPAAGQIQIRNHLILELDQPRVMSGNREVLAAQSIRAVISYHSIFTHGLPLHELDFESPSLTLARPATSIASGPLPHPNREMIDETMARLGDLAQVSRRLVIDNLELHDLSQTKLLSNGYLVAYNQRATPKLWSIHFIADCEFPQMQGARAAGNIKLGEGGVLSASQVLQGTFWFWQLPLRHLTLGNLEADGQSHGKVNFSVAYDAAIEGAATLGLNALIVRSPDLSGPLELGDYSLEAHFSTSSEQVAISNARLAHEGKPLVAAQASIDRPYQPNPQVAFAIAELKVAWKDVLASMRTLKRVPPELEEAERRVKSAQIEVERASLDSPLAALESMSPDAILAKLSISATISQLSFAPPAETQLPDVSAASARILFSKKTLSLVQGSANIGNSQLHDIEAKIDLSKSLAEVPYQISIEADLDLAQLRPAAMKMLDRLDVHERDRLQEIQGTLTANLDASGVLRKNSVTRPEKYLVTAEPHNVRVGFRGAPGPIGFASGVVIVQPDRIKLEKVSARATGGTADFDGELRVRDGGVATGGLKITMHQMPIERWLEGVVDPDDFSATGNVGGEVVVTGDPQRGFLANGKITLLNGRVQVGFLRSPIFVHPAILTVREHTLTVSMPAAELEKSPIDLTVAVPDLRNPSIRIDANLERFDVEALKFVRLPWMPPTPTHPPKIPISGHIDAREAILETFEMKNAKTDFKYRDGDWSVDNLTASSFGGHLGINIVGRQKDDWIHMFGKVQNFNAASLFLLKKTITRSPLTGHLDLTGDLWADTDSDFFATMAGTVIVKLRDGNIDKLTLLSRLLELIDLRSWITAKVPDPRASGIQFRSVTADFKGNDGVFYTDNLLLDGPVIDIVASGNVNLDQSTIDMKIGMIPFNTVNWALSHIPLVGKNVAGGTHSIISAYFNARGPITNPRVTPAPITSVAEIFKKTLGLPINLIKPNTIK